MPRKIMTFETVRAMTSALGDVEEGTIYGTPALKVRGKWFACVPSHRSAESDSLAVRVSIAERDELLAAQPDCYYVKEHYLEYPVVLVRLAQVHPDALRDLLTMAWQSTCASVPPKRPRARAKARRRAVKRQ